jgi:hypothetical protein
MTLAWFNKYRHTGFFDVAHDVKVNLAYVKQRQKSGAKSKTNEPAKPVAVKVPKSSDNLLLVEDDPTAGVPTLEEDVPEVDADGFTAGGLVTPHGHVARGLHKVEGATISIKGVLADEAGHTQTLTLPYDGAGNIQLDVEGRGLVTVGVLKDGDVKLCSGRYEAVCHLNYVAADGRLTIGLTEAEHQRGEANPNAIYQSLVSIGDYGVEYSPASDTAIDVRLVKAGAPTSPLRLAVRPEDGVILARGRPVGSLTGLSLCNGEYRNACRLVVNTENGGLHVFFK